jgi:hypothetical protein
MRTKHLSASERFYGYTLAGTPGRRHAISTRQRLAMRSTRARAQGVRTSPVQTRDADIFFVRIYSLDHGGDRKGRRIKGDCAVAGLSLRRCCSLAHGLRAATNPCRSCQTGGGPVRVQKRARRRGLTGAGMRPTPGTVRTGPCAYRQRHLHPALLITLLVRAEGSTTNWCGFVPGRCPNRSLRRRSELFRDRYCDWRVCR